MNDIVSIYLCSEYLIFVEGLLIGPQVIEPLDDSLFQLCGDLPEHHVLFDGVHAALEVGPGSTHVGDHAADVADDGGED